MEEWKVAFGIGKWCRLRQHLGDGKTRSRDVGPWAARNRWSGGYGFRECGTLWVCATDDERKVMMRFPEKSNKSKMGNASCCFSSDGEHWSNTWSSFHGSRSGTKDEAKREWV